MESHGPPEPTNVQKNPCVLGASASGTPTRNKNRPVGTPLLRTSNSPKTSDTVPLPETKSTHGWLELIIGPMFAGKSSELLRRLRRYELARQSVIYIKYVHDTRYETEGRQVITHDRVGRPAYAVERLSELDSTINAYQVIGIDEGQFMEDLVEFCTKWSDAGKIVIVAALDSTFQRKPFGSVIELIPVAEHVDKLTAVCVICGNDASFSHRLPGNGTEVEKIGGSDLYQALCRGCFLSK